jgi:hypothetical protein
MNTRRSSVKCLSWRSCGSLKSEAQNSTRKLGFEWILEERDWELKRVSQSICKLNWVANRAREVGRGFYIPPRESAHWGIRDPDMSSNPLLNPAWEPDMSGSGPLTRDKADRLNISRLGVGFIQSRGWTCPTGVTRTGQGSRISPVRLGLPKNKVRTRTCPGNISRI